MMRHVLSMLGGIALAIGLFWMLALLVAPPEQQVDEPIMSMSMTMVEAPEGAPEQETPPRRLHKPLPRHRPCLRQPLRRSPLARLRCQTWSYPTRR